MQFYDRPLKAYLFNDFSGVIEPQNVMENPFTFLKWDSTDEEGKCERHKPL